MEAPGLSTIGPSLNRFSLYDVPTRMARPRSLAEPEPVNENETKIGAIF
jgi:hypothetical protein